jgi:hypothetical protein
MKFRISIPAISAVLIAIAVIAACKSKPVATASKCTDTSLTFTNDIKPIMDLNCASTCHSAKKHAHGIDLSTYENVKAAAADKSFMGSIRHQGVYTPMPKNHDKLDEVTLQKISCWIDNGMKP